MKKKVGRQSLRAGLGGITPSEFGDFGLKACVVGTRREIRQGRLHLGCDDGGQLLARVIGDVRFRHSVNMGAQSARHLKMSFPERLLEVTAAFLNRALLCKTRRGLRLVAGAQRVNGGRFNLRRR